MKTISQKNQLTAYNLPNLCEQSLKNEFYALVTAVVVVIIVVMSFLSE